MMRTYSPDELASITRGTWNALAKTVEVRGFCFDARQIKPGNCFVALTGAVRDGHDFVEQAKRGGASAVLVERTLDLDIPQLVVADSLCALGALGAAARNSFDQPIIGVTGSCGKTSTKEMLRVLLGDYTHATAGNWNNRIGVPMTLLTLDSKAHHFGVIEAGINQPGEMQLLGEMIQADLSIVTNVGPAHLELLKTIDNIAVEKARLAQGARETSLVVITSDLLKYPAFSELSDRAIVLYPESEQAPQNVRRAICYRLYPREITPLRAGAASVSHKLTLIDSSVASDYTIYTPSEGIATNAALAIVAAQTLGVSIADTQQRITQWQPASNRGRVVRVGDQIFYVDCYNANPTSLSDALKAFRRSTPAEQPKVYILGGMNELGETAIEQHEAVGRQLKLSAGDSAIFVGPPELTGAYERGALTAGVLPDQLKKSETVEAIKSDIATFKGALFLKGSRSYQLEHLLP